jgi:hypothetical protein
MKNWFAASDSGKFLLGNLRVCRLMKPQSLLIVFLVSLLIAPVFLNSGSLVYAQTSQATPDVYIGIDVAYDNVTGIKSLIDEVSTYTNLFVIGCTGITSVGSGLRTENYDKLNEVCQYAYDRGIYFIVYREYPPSAEWIENAKVKWGNQFLGFYVYDELGGRQLDRHEYWMTVQHANDYVDATSQFISAVHGILYGGGFSFPQYQFDWKGNSLFSSDYAFYWFDYKAGYDTLLAQFGWNYSRQLNVALCRGAATVQNKDWGAIVAWEYTVPPYIESGEQLYKDLVLAYENGAKYIVVFDSDEGYTQTILKQEHLDALKQFWKYVQDNPRPNTPVNGRIGFVLPEGYAYGFRGPDDKIWGLWEADAFSYQLCQKVNSLLEQYGTQLDIIYDDGLQPGNNYGYSQLIYWNDTTRFPSPSPSPSPTSSPSPTPSLNPTPSPSQSVSPSPSPTPLPSQSPSPSSSPTQQPTSTPETWTDSSLSTNYAYVIVGGVAVGTIALTAFVLRRRALKR